MTAKLAAAPDDGAGSGSTAQGFIDGIFGNTLRGTVVTRSLEEPTVHLYEDRVWLAMATVERVTDAGRPPGDEYYWSYVCRLPDHLYDGLPHTLCAGGPSPHEMFAGFAVFIGDPAIGRGAAPDETAAPVLPGTNDVLDTIAGTLQAQTQALTALLAHARHFGGGGEVAHATATPATAAFASVPVSPSRRYGETFPDAAMPRVGSDFIWLGVIDWWFRIQRPQHLCMNLADLQQRVFYISIEFEPADEDGRFRILGSPHPGVYEIRLRLNGTLPGNIYGGLSPEQTTQILLALDELTLLLHVRQPTVIVQYPSWYGVAMGIPGATVVHDCLDLVAGFDETPPAMVALETELVRDADLVIVTSAPLAAHVGDRPSTIVRNAAEIAFFAKAADAPPRDGRRPVIGYIGAIAAWFKTDWVEHCARAHPNWDFVLVGSASGINLDALHVLPNVHILGERPYADLVAHLGTFDVAIIPFELLDLIKCVNPVKLYEYMAAGRPVVSSALPEVIDATDLAYIAHDAAGFESQIQRALDEDGPELRERRRAWAKSHDWENRTTAMLAALDPLTPKVSVVILTFNNWALSKASIDSVLRFSEYGNLELIVVDNASTDETRRELEFFGSRNPNVTVILNDRNLGYAAGNNVGIRAATGDYVVLLNNDTFVTRGWVRDLVRPLQQDVTLGMAVPLTNNMGNEQKVDIRYDDMIEMADEARRFVRRHTRERLTVSNVAFFCVAITREVIDRVGLLDETYGLGFFEDDDYCRRVTHAGYRMVVVDDVFVHHHLSASFNALGVEARNALMEQNKAIYESRWGPWTPHKYRDAFGFG